MVPGDTGSAHGLPAVLPRGHEILGGRLHRSQLHRRHTREHPGTAQGEGRRRNGRRAAPRTVHGRTLRRPCCRRVNAGWLPVWREQTFIRNSTRKLDVGHSGHQQTSGVVPASWIGAHHRMATLRLVTESKGGHSSISGHSNKPFEKGSQFLAGTRREFLPELAAVLLECGLPSHALSGYRVRC